MKCSNCGSEWNANVKLLQIKNCPFCGASLVNSAKWGEEIGAGEVIRLIIEQFGENILLEKNKFIAVFTDYAPNMKKEKKIFSIALDEKIAPIIINTQVGEANLSVQRIRNILGSIMVDTAIDIVVNSFAEALNWNLGKESSIEDEIVTTNKSINVDNKVDYTRETVCKLNPNEYAENAETQRFLARSYLNNNRQESIQWYKRAISNGDVISKVELAKVYIGSDSSEEQKVGLDMALKFDEEVINNKYDLSNQNVLCAVRLLADLHFSISLSGVKSAAVHAFRMYFVILTRGVTDNNSKLIDEAFMYCLGKLRFIDEIWENSIDSIMCVTDFDDMLISVLIEFASKSISPNLPLLLGEIYQKPTMFDSNESIKWYSFAMNHGATEAYYRLAIIYMLLGKYEKGVEFFMQGAYKNHTLCMLELGRCYKNGIGINKNNEQALFWWKNAANRGNEDARKLIRNFSI